MFFSQKSHHAEYFEVIYGEDDRHPFIWGKLEYSAGGEFKFNITLDTGAEVQLLVSPKGFFSFIHDKVTIQAAGPCQHEN